MKRRVPSNPSSDWSKAIPFNKLLNHTPRSPFAKGIITIYITKAKLKSESEGNCLLACLGTSTSMVSAIFGTYRAREDDSKSSSSCKTMQPMEANILESIMVASFTFTTLILLLPCDYIDGSPVPTIIFKGLPSTFHAFVVSLIFAFSGALSALLIHDTSFFAKFCEFSSMASMASALSLLLWAMSFTLIFRPQK